MDVDIYRTAELLLKEGTMIFIGSLNDCFVGYCDTECIRMFKIFVGYK